MIAVRFGKIRPKYRMSRKLGLSAKAGLDERGLDPPLMVPNEHRGLSLPHFRRDQIR